jgi:hypothetical protein
MAETLTTRLTDAGMSPEVASTLADMIITVCQVHDSSTLTTVPVLVSTLVTQSSNNPELGKTLFEYASQSASHEQLTLYLCSLICMYTGAKKEICRRLEQRQDFKKIQAALQSKSLYALLGALDGVCVEVEPYDVQLIIAFLVHYPHAYIAHFPDCPKTNQFALYTALLNALGCTGVLSDDIVPETNGEDGGWTQKGLAKLLLETMEKQ